MNKQEDEKPLPGESFEDFEDFLKRHKAHPSQPDRRKATADEERETDVTQERLERGYVSGER
jgi:hypothetical protein